MQQPINNFSILEEIYHAITHGVGIILSIVGLSVLVAYASLSGSTLAIISSAIYGATLIVLYGSSTLYHAVTQPKIKQLLQTFDHASIYLLIAGTYTPISLVTLGGVLGWSIFTINWIAATIGIYLKFVYPNRFETFSLFLYLVMGWLIVVAIKPLMEVMPLNGIYLLIIGGLFYTLGVFFYVKDSKPFYHAIWHLFVMAGSIFHYLMTLLYII